MNFPVTRGELSNTGWELSYIRNCKRCAKSLEFWRTDKNKFAPLEVTADNKLQSHFSTCPFADEFRKKEQPRLFA